MSFWKDASPVVRGAIVFGLLALVLLVATRILDDGAAEALPEPEFDGAAP